MSSDLNSKTKFDGIPKMMIVLSLISIFCTLSIAVPGQIRLEDCQTKAQQNYPLVKQYELIELSKEYSLSNAGKAYLPQLDITLIGGVIDGFPTITLPGQPSEASGVDMQMISILQLNQVIWDGGITKARKGIIEASSEIEKAELEVSLYALEDRVNNLFFGVLLIDEQIAQLGILKSTLERNKARVEVAVENGTAFKSDIDEITVELINVDQKVSELTFARSAYINVLSAMIGDSIPEDSKLERPVVETDFLNLEIDRPELKLIQNRYALIERQAQIDKATLYPKLGVMGFATFIQPGVSFGTSTVEQILVAGLSLNWSVGSLYQNGNKKKLTEVNLQKTRIQHETFLFNTNLALTQTRKELDKFKEIIAQDKELLALKSRIKKSYDVQYENGVTTMSKLLDRVNDESAARQNLILHEIQYLMKTYQYKNQSGN